MSPRMKGALLVIAALVVLVVSVVAYLWLTT